ncbi:alpha/beta hydrolase family protein [Mucilaginibacter sp. SP1R1]|uniref:alpha/beta hydrolase family protein n=1 Tax=Mucilaginibacter sp. SP1R1 TaxID=2723091 RepID=UPI0016168B41|nr:S9 family peptidase [Mucilaginibacter sp. SP1R1]MBB6150563.1 dipeptidyl aminopeptidase/acylaminoacyl peptidase [Mucilaginibacter sp. SP1R1]
MKIYIYIVIVFNLFVLNSVMAQAVKKPFKPTDVLHIPTLEDPQLSPDGKWLAYSLSEVDSAKDNRVSHLWMQSYDGKQSIELTQGADAASSPKWTPDGKYLSYVSERDSKNAQIWLMDRRGGEGKKLTDVKGELQDYAWSPDSKKLALIIKDPENGGKPEPKTTPPIKIDRYHFKQDIEGYLQHLHTHLYVYDVATKKLDTLTAGDMDDSSPAWSPDSKTIAFVSNHTDDPDRNENLDIFTMEAQKGARVNQLTTFTGHDINPLWSPDGKHIAYLRSTSDADYFIYQHDVLCLMDADGKNNKVLTAALDRPVSNHAWSRDGKNIAYVVSNDRIRYIAQYNLLLRKTTVIDKGVQCSFENLIAQSPGSWIAKMTTPYLPHELVAIENGKIRRLTFHQDQWLNGVKLAYVKGFQSFSADGTLVSGILYTPDSVVTKKLPFVLFIHGGPTDQDEFEFDVTRQILASAGYAVAAVNYRGSTGRGVEYTKAIYADWGNKEVKDLLGAVDELVKTGVADPQRLGIGGWSYGGILTDYTIASDTRFKAAASGAGSALQLSMYGSDQWVVQYDNELGVPWKNADKYIKLSYPFFHADKIKTPTMFMSGLKDFNVPTAGGEQMYEALKSQDIPTQLVLYPGQYHGITVPSYQVDRLQRYIDWFGKYLNPSIF